MHGKLIREGNGKLEKIGLAFTRPGDFAGSSSRIAREYFDSLMVEFRVIDAVEADTKMELFGQTFATPIMMAALSRLDAVVPDGMAAAAKGAEAAGAVMWSGIGTDDELKAMIDTGARVVKVVKPYRDTDLIFRKIETAEKMGAFALGMDIDFMFGRKNGTAPAPMSPKTLEQMRSFVKATRMPFIFKGVLSERDAMKALEAGAGGIVVSHHGGYVLDYAVPPLQILPRIAAVIKKRIPVFLDGGVTSGLDAFKALALGASAVSAGNAVVAGLAEEGADGVANVLKGLTAELQRALSLTGHATIRDIDPAVIWRKGGSCPC